MKNFTKLFCLMALCLSSAVSVNAQDEEVALTADMFKTWDGYGADASATGSATVDFNIGNDVTVNAGGMVCGTSTVDYLTYADLTGASKLIIEGTAGMQLRVLMNRQESNNGPLVEKNPTLDAEGKAEVDLTDLAYVHVNAIKAGWGSAAGTIASIKYVKPSDPLAIPREVLTNAIAQAKLQTAVGKTEASYAALQTAIANAQAALADADATEASLTAATTALNEAVAGLALADGYSNLTADMFMQYASLDEPGEGTAVAGAPCVLLAASDLPYGDGNVSELKWADLKAYDKLIVTVATDILPRFCMNRLEANGQCAATKEESKMLDINPNNSNTWATEAYQTIEGKTYTIDLTKIVDDYGFARLHCIKKQGWGAGVVVTDMLLYKASLDPVGIKEVKAAEQTEGIFNMAGQRVAKAQKGLYIINGKKVMVK